MRKIPMFDLQPAGEWNFAVLQAAGAGVDAALAQIAASDPRLVSYMTWEGEGGVQTYLLMSHGPIDEPALLQRLQLFRLPVSQFVLHPVPADDDRWQTIGDDLTMLGALMNAEPAARKVSAERRAARRAA